MFNSVHNKKLLTLIAIVLVSNIGLLALNSDRVMDQPVVYKTVEVGSLNIFYREAGPVSAPTVLLLHGFPTSSQMFQELMEALSDRFHLVAPDYPGFGNSSMPTADDFDYTFDNLALVVEQFTEVIGLDSYSLYVMDYGATR